MLQTWKGSSEEVVVVFWLPSALAIVGLLKSELLVVKSYTELSCMVSHQQRSLVDAVTDEDS